MAANDCGLSFRAAIRKRRRTSQPAASEQRLQDNGRPLLGRKIRGKSRRELKALGLAAIEGPTTDTEK